MGKYTIVNSVWFRPYMKAGKMSIVEVNNADTSAYISENFMVDAEGNYVKFATEGDAVNWLCDNIKTELIHADYVEKLIRPSSNREYWLKEDVVKQEKVVQLESSGEMESLVGMESGDGVAEVVQLVTYRLYVEKGKVRVVRIMGGNIENYNEYQFMDKADGSKLVFETEQEAVDWMSAKLKMTTIHPDYLEKAGYTVYKENSSLGGFEDSYSFSGLPRR